MKILFSILLSVFTCTSFAQNQSVAEARYIEQWSIDTLTRHRGTDTVILRMTGVESSYWSRNQYFRDSLLALPDGRRQFMRMATQLVAKKGQSALYSNLGEYLYRIDGKTITQTTLNLGTTSEAVEIVEQTEIPQWHLLDSERTIEGYVCLQAETHFRGRHWIAWYAPQIPLMHGPWKLCGLPGLIVEAYDVSDDYHYRLVQLKQLAGCGITKVNPRNYRYRKIGRLDYLRKLADYMQLSTAEQVSMSTGDSELSGKFSSEMPNIQRDFRERDGPRSSSHRVPPRRL